MQVFRLSREKYALPLSGKGAAIKGARWNSAGIEMIYTAGNRSLAMAEVAVHFSLAAVPSDYVMLTIEIPDSVSMLDLQLEQLPPDWREFPHPATIQLFGNQFVREAKACVLKVPSVVTAGDFNYLINPNHPEFERIDVVKMEHFPFDRRLLR
jgi:RES domain-containing protein